MAKKWLYTKALKLSFLLGLILCISSFNISALPNQADNRIDFTYTKYGNVTIISGGGTNNHAELNNLTYASSGHTGFQPAGSYLTSESDPIFDAWESAGGVCFDGADCGFISSETDPLWTSNYSRTMFNDINNNINNHNITNISRLIFNNTGTIYSNGSDLVFAPHPDGLLKLMGGFYATSNIFATAFTMINTLTGVGAVTSYGALIQASGVGSQTNVGADIHAEGGAVNQGLRMSANNEGGGIFFGASQDGSIYYDNTNLVINPKETGSGALDIYGDVEITDSEELRFWDEDNSNSVNFKSVGLSADTTYTLPLTDGTTGQVLTTNGSGYLNWTTSSGGNSSFNQTLTDGLYAKYNFTTNNFNGSGNFTTTGYGEFDKGILSVGSTTGYTIPTGAGTRLMWIPSKQAFRVGGVQVLNPNVWNETNIGISSVAIGVGPQASGVGSIAMGYDFFDQNRPRATGEYSTALGLAIASGTYSVAMGYATSSGSNSFAVGQSTASNTESSAFGYSTASGVDSTSFGKSTTASGSYSIAGGFNTLASGTGSVCFGNALEPFPPEYSYIKSIGVGTFAGGDSESATDDETYWNNATIQAGNTATTKGSFAYGVALAGAGGNANLKSTGRGSVAMGYANAGNLNATGNGAIAMGENVASVGNNIITFGKNFTEKTASTFAVGFEQKDFSVVSGKTSVYGNLNVTGNVTANVYHGNIDWVYTIIGMSGNTACDNLDNKITGYSYTCQTCIDTAGSTIACGTTLVTLNANCGCKID